MTIPVNVAIECTGDYCSIKCPFFRLEPGASFERPVVEYCKLFNQDLKAGGKKVLRCTCCHDEERNWPIKMRRFYLMERCRGKEAALKLLQLTDYKVDIWEYTSCRELLVDLIDFHKLGSDYLKSLLGIDQEAFDLLLKGVEYPYLIKPIQQRLGFPKPVPLKNRELI